MNNLPIELQSRILVLAQNDEFPFVSSSFYRLSQSPLVRAQYLQYRFGSDNALGERSLSYRIANRKVIECLLRMRCNPRADDYWLYWRICQQQDAVLGQLFFTVAPYSLATIHQFLNIAATKGAIPIIDCIAEQFGPDIIHYGDDVALVICCVENQVEAARHLITRYGCDPHSHDERYLRRACLHGHTELVDLLLPGANVHAFHNSALQNAVYRSHQPIVERLLMWGANPRANDNSALLLAIANGHVAITQLLLNAGADPRCADDRPIRLACRRGLTDIVDLLIQEGVDANAQDGLPLYEAMRSNHTELVEKLLAWGASPNTPWAIRGRAYTQGNMSDHLFGGSSHSAQPISDISYKQDPM